ncbi:flagellar biosynthesis regulator FlhF [Geomicrobium sp. JCM 19038]|nr:flagellar biosynthesis regulator FlhF [Geomicrobium sp. JCM 19038]
MNVKKFRGKTTAEAMKKVRQAFGANAVILHKKPSKKNGGLV